MITALLIAFSAHADAPEYLLGDLGVRLDLPSSTWHMSRWSDSDFRGKTHDNGMHLLAWSSTGQVPLTGPADAWGSTFLAKVEEMSGKDGTVSAARAAKVGDRDVVFVDAGFLFGDGGKGAMVGAVVPIADAMFYVLIAGPGSRASGLSSARDRVVADLEVRRPPKAVAFGTALEGAGATTQLPPEWRVPLESELEAVVTRASAVGIESIEACASAIRPLAGSEPQVMLTCPGRTRLGVVDDVSWEGVAAEVHRATFGPVPVPPPMKLTLKDRLGFGFAPPFPGVTARLGVVPAKDGVTRTWVVGAENDTSLDGTLTTMMAATTWSGSHPVTSQETVSYYLTYRKTSPMVLLPALFLVGLVVAAGALAVWVATRKPAPRSDLD